MTGRPGWFLPVQKLVWCVAPLLAVCMVGCGGSEYRFPGHRPKPEVTSVTVVCSPSTIQPGQTSQCTATVLGQGSITLGVEWSASAGQISTAGLFTAPSLPTSVTITAVSTWDRSKSGTFTVTVGPSQAGNVQPIVVDAGAAAQTFLAAKHGSLPVKVCVPGATPCQPSATVQVNTGSSGRRLLSSASGGELGLTL